MSFSNNSDHLDLTNAYLDIDNNIVINEFEAIKDYNGSSVKSGVNVTVSASNIVTIKRYSLEYIQSAIDACNSTINAGNSAPRLNEWNDILDRYNSLIGE